LLHKIYLSIQSIFLFFLAVFISSLTLLICS
jgi:hypothetical protein